jgi:DMSO/TMAO reductase YedYZ heme-binding membrane subunit
MIQRQQTLWLLLSVVTGILSFFLPFATGGTSLITKNVSVQSLTELSAGENFFIMILMGASIILALVTIFQFKNRKQQSLLCMIGMAVSVLILVIYFVQYKKLIRPTLALYCILPLGMIAGYFMAWRKIRSDEKLVKSLDKLR